MSGRPDFRVAGEADVDAVTDTITSAFSADPVWGPIFGLAAGSGQSVPRREMATYRSWWTLFVETAVGYGSVWVTSACEAAAVWIPAGLPELGPDQEARAERVVQELPQTNAEHLLKTVELFEAAPPEAPHYYLSLLGTHDDHRGHGLGMALLRHCLAQLDDEGHDAYLESTNPANLDRYRSVGFADLGGFSLPDSGPYVTTMWRPSQQTHA